MIKKILIVSIFLFPFLANAEIQTEKYMVERPDGGVSIVYYIPDSGKSLNDVLAAQGYENYPVYAIAQTDIPTDRSDRNYWKRSGGKIVVDPEKKQADLDIKNQKQAEKDAILAKLKISDQELDTLND